MAEQELKYDLLVIGSGAAGFYAAREAARAGLKTAVVEKAEPGGTAFYWGSLPVKMIADKIKAYQKAKSYFSSFRAELKKEDFLLQDSDFKKIEAKIQNDLKQAGAELFYGQGRFISNKEFELGEKLIRAERVIIASGSRVKTGAEIELDGNYIISHKEAVLLKKLPQSLLIVGMNIEGAEFASIFSFLGVKVYMLEQENELLPGIDRDLTQLLKTELENNGVEMLPSTLLKNARLIEAGNKKVVEAELESTFKSDFESGRNQAADSAAKKAEFKEESNQNLITVDRLLFTAGREPNFPQGIENMGLEFDQQQIKVNQKLQTSSPNVYALGDVNGRFGIASTAVNDALIAVNEIKRKMGININLESTENISAPNQPQNFELKTAEEQLIPLNIFTIPEIGGLGLSEEQLKAKNIDYRVQKYYFKDCWRGINSNQKGFLKIMLAPEDSRVLGIYLVGSELSEIVSALSLTAENLNLQQLIENIYVQPTRSEILREAALKFI